MTDQEALKKLQWPELPLQKWEDTFVTLHRWTQIAGKIRLALAPMLNQWWQVVLYVTPRGLTTGAIPGEHVVFSIDFDLIGHEAIARTSAGKEARIDLRACSVADFYRLLLVELRSLGIAVTIWPVPVEVADRTPFYEDNRASYDPDGASALRQVLISADRTMQIFRSRFRGKASPVHFFWGAFDLAATRFSGRAAPRHPPAPNVAEYVVVEAYNEEVSSCGFWPGMGVGRAYFYAYAYPEPDGFSEVRVRPPEAYYDETLREFLLPYDAVREAKQPEQTLLDFLQSTYEAAAEFGAWDRLRLERH